MYRTDGTDRVERSVSADRSSSLSTRDGILSAAARIVIERGASRMTLEAVAREAGVSKGGLLYHFESKDALIRGMVELMVQRHGERIRSEYERDDVGTNQGRWLRALTRTSFASEDQELGAGLTAAVLLNPDLLEANRRAYELRQGLIEQDGVDVVVANIIRLAGDGLWFSELLGFAPPPEPLKARILERLLQLTTGDGHLRTERGRRQDE
jgi:AcrR family transcriptional regulator